MRVNANANAGPRTQTNAPTHLNNAEFYVPVISTRRQNDGGHHQYHSRFGNTLSPSAFADSLHHASSTQACTPPERYRDTSDCGNYFQVTIELTPGRSFTDSLAPCSQAPNLDRKSIMNSFSSNEPASGCNGILEGDEPCPPYVKGVG